MIYISILVLVIYALISIDYIALKIYLEKFEEEYILEMLADYARTR
jgi:hypothetical protein